MSRLDSTCPTPSGIVGHNCSYPLKYCKPPRIFPAIRTQTTSNRIRDQLAGFSRKRVFIEDSGKSCLHLGVISHPPVRRPLGAGPTGISLSVGEALPRCMKMMVRKANTDALPVYTIGHSNVPIARLITLLKDSGIEALVDVRSRPFSSYVPQFNKQNVEKTLEEAGISYTFLGDRLGGYPSDATCYSVDPKTGQRKPDYDVIAGKPWFKAGLDELSQIAKATKTALMCSEEEPGKCHRHRLIAKALSSRGFQVLHIRGTGTVQLAAFDTPAASHTGPAAGIGPRQNSLFSEGMSR
jgi:hypothetical protein